MKRFLALPFLLLALPATAQLRDDFLQPYKLEGLKEGEWVEYETSEDDAKSTWKMACVEVDEEHVWIETNVRPKEAPDSVKAMLYAMSKATGRLAKAWYEQGGEVREIPVRETTEDEKKAAEEEGRADRLAASALGKDNQRAGEKVVACEKVEFRATFYVNGKEVKSKAVVWVSTSVPFKYKSWEASGWMSGWQALEFKPRKPPSGALVRAELEAWNPKLFKTKENVAKTVIRLVKFGNDAKPDLFMRR